MCLWHIVECEDTVAEFEEKVGTEGYEGPEWQLGRDQQWVVGSKRTEENGCAERIAGRWRIGRGVVEEDAFLLEEDGSCNFWET